MSIPAHPKTNPTVVKVRVSLKRHKDIPKVLKIQANINTFYLPITSLNTPKINAITPPKIIKIP